MGVLALLFFLGVPAVLSLINLATFIEAFTDSKKISNFTKSKYIDIITIVLGIIFSGIFWIAMDFKEYYEAIQINIDIASFHAPLSAEHLWTPVIFFIIGCFAYILLRFKFKKLAPLALCLSLSALVFANLVGAIFIIQIGKNLFFDEFGKFTVYIESLLLILFPLNFIFLSTLKIKEIIESYIAQERVYNNKLLKFLNLTLLKSKGYVRVSFILLFPLYALITIILILFGQRPDSLIEAFTQTSDWTLSQQISPPPIETHAHYLCTVSLRGNKKLVKPLRYGLRRGNKIVINRQLMIANAFEELIQEKSPRLHKVIRSNYDKYGYPLSNIITTENRANFTYILMKPLEYIFLIVLYLFDKNPENRIASQYLPSSFRNKSNKFI